MISFFLLILYWKKIDSNYTNLVINLPYFIIGVLLSHYNKIKWLENKVFITVSILSILLLSCFFTPHTHSVQIALVKFVVSIASIQIFYVICNNSQWKKNLDTSVRYFGRISLAIYVSHWPFLEIEIHKNQHINMINNEMLVLFFVVILSFLICYTCGLIKKVISLSPLLDLIFYGNYGHSRSLKGS